MAIFIGNSDVLAQKLLYIYRRDTTALLACGNRRNTSEAHKVS